MKVKILNTDLNRFFNLVGKIGEVVEDHDPLAVAGTGKKQVPVKIDQEIWWMYEEEIEEIGVTDLF